MTTIAMTITTIKATAGSSGGNTRSCDLAPMYFLLMVSIRYPSTWIYEDGGDGGSDDDRRLVVVVMRVVVIMIVKH